jgi:hypothetical protein
MAGIPGSTQYNLANPVPGVDMGASLVPQIGPMRPSPSADAPPVPMADPAAQQDMVQPAADAQVPQYSDSEINAQLDQHLAGDTNVDDALDSLLNESPPVDEPGNRPGDRAESALLMKGANSLMGGYLPQVSGKISELTGGDYLEGGGLTPGRDQVVRKLAEQQKEFPVLSTSATVGGGVLPALATGGASAVAEAVPWATTLLRGAMYGGGYGLAANPGDQQGVVDYTQALDRLKNGITGALAGTTLAAAGRGLGAVFGKAMSVEPVPPQDVGDEVKILTPEIGVQAEINAVKETQQAAKEAGIPLFAHEVAVNDPDMAPLAEAAFQDPAFQTAQKNRGAQIVNLVEKVKGMFNTGKETVSTAFDKLSSMQKYYGKYIESFRDEVVAAGQESGKKMQLPHVDQALDDVYSKLNFTKVEGGGWKAPTGKELDDLASSMNVNKKTLSLLIKEVQGLADKVATASPEGHFSPEQLLAKYDLFKQIAKGSSPAMGQEASDLALAARKIRDALGDDFASESRKFLSDPARIKQYDQALSRYSTVKNFPRELKTMLKAKSPAVDDVLGWLNNGGIKNTERVTTFMNTLEQESPEAAEAIRQGYVTKLFDKFRETDTDKALRVGGYKWDKFYNHLTDGANFDRLQLVVGEQTANSIRTLAKATKAISEHDAEFVKPHTFFSWAKALVSVAHRDPSAAFTMMSSSRAAKQLMSAGTMDKVIKRMSTVDQKMFNSVYSNVVEAAGLSAARNKAATNTGEEATQP